MTGEIRRSDEVSHDELTKMIRDSMEMTRNRLSSDLDFQKEILQRITRVETSLEHLTNTIEKFINVNNETILNLNKRVDKLEKLADEAHGALKMLKISLGVVSSVVVALIGLIMKYVR